MVIRAPALDTRGCLHCDTLRAELAEARRRVAEIQEESEKLRAQLRETLKLVDLQKADIDRLRAEQERAQPNRPERAPESEMQLAFERVVATFGDLPAANDATAAAGSEGAPVPAGKDAETQEQPPGKRRHRHGRRRLDVTALPVEIIHVDPDEVREAGGAGFVHIGDDTAERIAFKPAQYIRLRIVRRKYVPAETARRDEGADKPSVLVAPLPDSLWPRTMADPSAIAHVIISKYDDVLPLHRQERISHRNGFVLPRSTQCGWLGAAYDVCYRVVDAMMAEAKSRAFCIATDATTVPMRAKGECDKWTVFVFIADHDHVVFRHDAHNNNVVVAGLLRGFRGHLLADAAPVYDALYRGGDIIEHACWFHARRYFWKAVETERGAAMEALAIIGKLFDADRSCRDLAMAARTEARAAAARPILELFDKWVEEHRDRVDPGGRLDKAIGYYDNQREALHRFLADGRIRLDNNISEAQLRNVILGVNNWTFFANENGLRWYTAFRSLIASCRLHGLNPQDYLEQLLRLAPHWPITRMIELAPKHWSKTIAGLDDRHRAILSRPWDRALTAPGPAPASERAA
jgi:transposase